MARPDAQTYGVILSAGKVYGVILSAAKDLQLFVKADSKSKCRSFAALRMTDFLDRMTDFLDRITTFWTG